eukprot:TRINITY_DN7641_c0_g1_i1.p1 TRINITY_DN7641_c0_g1~~TRINITY_DN7641_c0_g1_i1.p1  ORF type:complete len:302 (-),score=61.09 TRINITY_DN7641_c0_g1_i1:67-864(-)
MAPAAVSDGADISLANCRSLENLSLGGVAAMCPPTQLPKKYRTAGQGEVSTFQGAGVVPVTRLPDGTRKLLLWQPQKGKKKGVRWYDFGGRKKTKEEFTTACACRKFAKETYGIFGCNLEIDQASGANMSMQLQELYQGLHNLPLMLRASDDWAQVQMLGEESKVFYNDIHEYHSYMLCVPHISDHVLNEVSRIVDGGKRIFRWMTAEELAEEVLAPRLHTASFAKALETFSTDEWVRDCREYGGKATRLANGAFSAHVIKKEKK